MTAPIASLSRLASVCCLFACGATIAGLAVAVVVTQRFRSSLTAGTPDHGTGGAWLALALHVVGLVVAGIGLVVEFRRTGARSAAHPVVLVVAFTLLGVCLLGGVSDYYLVRQIIDTGWTGY